MTTPDCMPSVCVIDTMFPSRSTTERWVVSALSAALGAMRGTTARSPRRMEAAAASCAAASTKGPCGTGAKSGSPIRRSLSTCARFMTSASSAM